MFESSQHATVTGGVLNNAKTINTTNYNYSHVDERVKPLGTIQDLLRAKAIRCQKKHEDVRRVVRDQKAAGEWLLRETKYTSWKTEKSSERLFWLTGVPGAGKTVLSSGVIDDILKATERDSKIRLMYFYSEYQASVKHTATTVFASLLLQLLNFLPATANLDLRQYAAAASADDLPPHSLMMDVIRQCMQTTVLEKIFIVIDGLDECDELKTLTQDVLTLAEHARVFVASRDHPVISGTLKRGNVLQLTVQSDDIAGDVWSYVTAEVQSIQDKFDNGKDIAKDIVDKLTSGAGGTFLWPVFHMQKLLQLGTSDDIQKALQHLPEGIEGTFKDALSSIRPRGCTYNPEVSKHLLSVLRWVVCATRPLGLRELKEAVAIPNMNGKWDLSRIPQWKVDECANLLICGPLSSGQPDSHIVVPFHTSVKEFLLKNPMWMMEPTETDALSSGSLEDVHDELARSCLSFMSLRHAGQSGEPPFAKYAIGEWLGHIRQASGTPELAKVFRAFLGPGSSPGESWRKSFVENSFAPHLFLPPESFGCLNAAHMAVVLDIPAVIPHFELKELMAKNDQGLPLRFAIKRLGWQTFRSGRPDLDTDGPQVNKRPNHFLVIERLVKQGAHTDDDKSGRTPLHIAAIAPGYHLGSPEEQEQKAKNYVAVMQMLLENGASVGQHDGMGRTALHLAAQEGVDLATEFLLGKTVAINAPSVDGHTPLHLAIGHRLNNRSWSKQNPTATTTVPGFPEYGHRQLTIEHLLDHRADVNSQTTVEKWSPLHVAASTQSDLATFDRLLDYQAVATLTGHQQNTPLHLAAKMAPIMNVEMPERYWDVSWVACRQIIEMLIPLTSNDENDLYSMRSMAKGVLKLLEKNALRPASAGVQSTDDPCTVWFDGVMKRMQAKKASIDTRNYQGYNVLRYAMSFWVSWIFRYHEAVRYRITWGELPPTHISSLNTAYAEWTEIDKCLDKAKASQSSPPRRFPRLWSWISNN